MRRLQAAVGSAMFLVAAPGVVAGLVPFLLTGWRSSNPPVLFAVVGAVLIAVGLGVLLSAFGRFVLEGRGTPAPIAPTERLVVGGLYRHVRNPMYLAVGATIVGQALLLGRPLLLAYAALFWLVVATFVRGYEEPTLGARYGEEYAAYRSAVPAWWPRLRLWSPHARVASGAMPKRSAGILLYRGGSEAVEVLLVHPGGPFWQKKDLGAWSIPKGEYEQREDPRACALREFEEELGAPPPAGALTELGTTRLAGGKLVTAWAAEGDLDPASVTSNTFTLEWPPRSGAMREFPEVDRAQWFALAEARRRLNPAQVDFLERLGEKLAER